MEISTIDEKNIVNEIYDSCHFDFRNYLMFRRRIEKAVRLLSIKDMNHLIKKIKNENDFSDRFLMEIFYDNIELFRDYDFWIYLREKWFRQLYNKENKIKIWYPDISSGEELYSMIILLEEIGLMGETEILATSISLQMLLKIKSGSVPMKKMNHYIANYTKINGKGKLSDYFIYYHDMACLDPLLLKNVKFIRQSLEDNTVQNVNLAMFRNRMLNYTLPLQNKILDIIYRGMLPGGSLIIGVKENITNYYRKEIFIPENHEEKIFKKIE